MVRVTWTCTVEKRLSFEFTKPCTSMIYWKINGSRFWCLSFLDLYTFCQKQRTIPLQMLNNVRPNDQLLVFSWKYFKRNREKKKRKIFIPALPHSSFFFTLPLPPSLCLSLVSILNQGHSREARCLVTGSATHTPLSLHSPHIITLYSVFSLFVSL